MMFWVAVLLAALAAPHAAEGHQCIHDLLVAEESKLAGADADGVAGATARARENSRRRQDSTGSCAAGFTAGQLASHQYRPINIKVVTDALDSDDQDGTCMAEGDLVLVGEGAEIGVSPSCSETTGVVTNCIHLCREEDVLTAEKRAYIADTVIPQAVSELEATLRVRLLGGTLTLESELCGFSSVSRATVPASVRGGLTDGTSFVIFVTARPTFYSALAYALPCEVDQIGRPISGHFNWGPNAIDDTQLAKQIGVARHELFHALGFVESKFNDFVDRDTGCVLTGDDALLSTVSDAYPTGASKPGGVQSFTSPSVVAAMERHFGCSDLSSVGAFIEDQGGAGSAGSHWEKRIFQNEFMTATADANPILSAISLAAMHDSGWYETDWETYNGGFLFGRGQGCSFITDSCLERDTSKGLLCRTILGEACTFDRTFKGICPLMQQGNAVPTEYQLFSDPTLGSSLDEFADWCPVPTRNLESGDCTDSDNGVGQDPQGQTFGSDSLCFTSTLLSESYQYTGATRTACHQMACVNGTQNVAVLKLNVDSNWVDCPSNGLEGTASVPDFRGSVRCPPANDLCEGRDLDNSWPIVESVSPDEGGKNGGTRVTIRGGNFVEGNEYSVKLGDARCRAVRRIDDNELQCVTPRVALNQLNEAKVTDVVVSSGNRKVRIAEGFTFTNSAASATAATLAILLALVALVA